MTVGGLNGLLAYNSLEEGRTIAKCVHNRAADGAPAPAAASQTASSVEERYTRAAGKARDGSYTGYRLDLRV